MTKITIQEAEVADAAHYMGYILLRSPEGYVLARKYGPETEIVKAATLQDIAEHLMH